MSSLLITSNVLEVKEAKKLARSNISLLDARIQSLNLDSEFGKKMAEFYAERLAAQKAALESFVKYDVAV